MDNIEEFLERETLRSQTFGNQAYHALNAVFLVIDRHLKTSFASGFSKNAEAVRIADWLHQWLKQIRWITVADGQYRSPTVAVTLLVRVYGC